MVIIKWFKVDPRDEKLGGGRKLTGLIGTGEIIDDFDPIGKPKKREVLQEGIELTLEQEPSLEELKAINSKLVGYKRDYTIVPFKEGEVRDLESELDEIKQRLDKVEKVPRGL